MLSIRTINASDWSQYRNLRLESLQDSPHAFASTFENESKRSCEDWQNKIQAALDSGRNHIFLAEYEGVNCGLVWCRLSEVDLNLAEIFQMWVNPDFRNLNIGQELMKAAINCANQNGANRIQLEVAVTNQPTVESTDQCNTCVKTSYFDHFLVGNYGTHETVVYQAR